MMPELIALAFATATGLGVFALGQGAGIAKARRKDGAMAVCVACEHTTATVSLSTAVTLAKRHKAATGHPCMVVATPARKS